ncbi:MAG: hypothetical protein ACTHMM_21210 [Agriterribacter sp.]
MVVYVKDSWAQVTLDEFQQILEVQQDKVLNDFQKELKIIQILSTINEDELNSLPITELKPLIKATDFLGSEIHQVDLKEYYKVNGNEYRLTRDITKINGGQFTDLMNLLQDKEQVNNNLHYIVAILMAPVYKKGFLIKTRRVEKYLEKKTLDEIAEDVKQMSIQDIHSIANFFFALSSHFQAAFFSYSQKEIPNQLKQVLKILKEKESKNQKLTKVEKDLQAQIPLLLSGGDFGIPSTD